MKISKSAQKDGIKLHVTLLSLSGMWEHKEKGGLGFIEEI